MEDNKSSTVTPEEKQNDLKIVAEQMLKNFDPFAVDTHVRAADSAAWKPISRISDMQPFTSSLEVEQSSNSSDDKASQQIKLKVPTW